MPSTYTTNGGIELPANGEQSGTWGETVNDNMAIIDRLTNGVGAISLSGTTHTLTTADGTLSDGQYNVLVLGGSPSGTNTITISPNDGEHVYVVKNASGQTATFTQGSGANVSVLNNTTKIIYADGAGAGAAVVDITGALDLGSLIIAGTSVTATAAELNILDGVTATAAELNYNDITTLGTVQASKTVTANASGDVLFPDGDKAIFGAGSDLSIYHDGNNKIEAVSGYLRLASTTSSTYVDGNDVHIRSGDGGETLARFNDDSDVKLYYDNALKLATTATGIDVTGTVAAGAGTALLPSITTTGDLNTGMWFPAADTIAFSEGGVEALRIDSSGNVGIGTSSPSFASGAFNGLEISYSTIPTLRLTDTSNTSFDIFKNGLNVILVNRDAGYLRFDTSNSDRMLIDASGNVGIGTSSPTFVTGDGLHVQRTGSATVRVERTGSTASAGEFFAGNDQVVIQSLTATAPLAFRTGGNPATERMRIDSSGNVGIGTTSPYNPGGYDRVLDIRGANGSQIVIGGTASNPTSTALQVDASNGNFLLSNNKGGSSLVFRTSVSDDDRTERMRIDSSGNVLIGTTVSPATLLTDGYSGFAVDGQNDYIVASRFNDTAAYFKRENSDGPVVAFYRDGTSVGTISVTTSATSYNTSSDYRLKTDAQPMTGASARVLALKPINFAWKVDGTRVDGFLAHEAQEVVPEAVRGTKDAMRDEEYEVTAAVYEDIIIAAVLDEEGNELEAERTEQRLVSEAVMGTRSVPDMQGIDQSKLVPLLTAALQEALNKIDAMEIRLSALEG